MPIKKFYSSKDFKTTIKQALTFTVAKDFQWKVVKPAQKVAK